MENSGSKAELVKPILLMAGIPLAGFLIARFTDRKISSLKDQIGEVSIENEIPDRNPVEEQLLNLRSKIEELLVKEWEVEERFFRYNDLKDQELALVEFQNSLVMEKERAEFLERQVSSMEDENKKFDEMVIDYLKALDELKSSRVENGLLRKRVVKLLKKTRESSRLVRRQNSKIEAREAEILSNQVELNRKENMIRGLESEIEELHSIICQLQHEKNQFLNKLQMAENSASLKEEAERLLMEENKRLVKELEQMKKERAGEVKELICLRWRHACLKHELMRKNQAEVEANKGDTGITEDIDRCLENESIENNNVGQHEEPFFGFVAGDQRQQKRPWLVRKLKKWVDKEKHHELFGSHSAVDENEERHFNGSKSPASA